MFTYQWDRVVGNGVKQNEKEDYKFLILVFWDLTQFKLVEDDLPERNNVSIYTIKQYKENVFFFTLV
jgi:hypothetical protein